MDGAGHGVHKDVLTFGGGDVQDGVPALAQDVFRPIVVGHDDAAVLGGAAGGDEGAAVSGGLVVARAGLGLGVQVRNVIPGQLDPAAQGGQVGPVIGRFREAGLDALGEAFDLVLVFRVQLGPEHPLGRFPEKGPFAVGRLLEIEGQRFQNVVDLGGQVPAVLEPDVAGRALEMDVNPAAAVFAERAGQAGVGGRGRNDGPGCGRGRFFGALIAGGEDKGRPGERDGGEQRFSIKGHGVLLDPSGCVAGEYSANDRGTPYPFPHFPER